MIARTKTQSGLYLWIICMLATVAMMPYSFELNAHDMPFPTFFVFQQLVYAALFYAAIIIFAFQLAQSIGLAIPFMHHEGIKKTIALPIAIGAFYALGIVYIDAFVFKHGITHHVPIISICVSAFRCILAMLYNAINEEIVLRLFVLTFCMWLLSFIIKKRNINAACSIFIAAILFGLADLPAFFNNTQIVLLSGTYLARSMMFNFLGGILFGWVYYRYGLIAAVLCHFAADLTGYFISGIMGLA